MRTDFCKRLSTQKYSHAFSSCKLYFSTKSTDNILAVICSGRCICDASLSRKTAQGLAPHYKRIGPFLLSIKFPIEKVIIIFSILRVILMKSIDFFKFKRSIRSSVFLDVIFGGMYCSED